MMHKIYDSINSELLLCCDCGCLSHIIRFVTYSPVEEDDVIYSSVFKKNLYKELFPPLSFCSTYWDFFFKWHYFKRFYYAFCSFFTHKKNNIFDCFDFQLRDLNKLYNFFSDYQEEEIDFKEVKDFSLSIIEDNKKHKIVFEIERMVPDDINFPWVIGFTIQFNKSSLIKKIKTAWEYIINDESEFYYILNKSDVKKFKALIKEVIERNKKEEVANEKP